MIRARVVSDTAGSGVAVDEPRIEVDAVATTAAVSVVAAVVFRFLGFFGMGVNLKPSP